MNTDQSGVEYAANGSGDGADSPGSPSERAHYSPRLRRRLALAFSGAIVVTVLLLSVGSYLTLRAVQEQEALDAALAQTRFNLLLADTILPDQPTPADYDRLLQALAIRGDFQTLIDAGGDTYRSGPQITPTLVRDGLSQAITSGRLNYQSVTMSGGPALAVGSKLDPVGSFYFLFPQGERQATLNRLRDVLVAAGLILVVLGSALGYALARRTLRPVSAAVTAATRVAAGDLGVRLPVGADEFGALADSFNTMAANLQTKIVDLEESRARERRFVADVAHELRTPVAALVGEASLLRSRLEDPSLSRESRRAVELVVHDVGRLWRLIEDLLEISRMDAGAEEVRLEEFDAAAFLEQVSRARGWPREVELRVGPVAPADPVAVAPADPAYTAGPASAGIPVVTDRRRLERIVVNLVENALRHGAPPIWVDARVVHDPHGVQSQLALDVTDHGVGMPPEQLRHVFERFYKADPSRTSSGGAGSGLGLAIAWENAHLLGGQLRVKSNVGEGTRFSLRIPLRS
ncbi:MAG: ATP-binding protein [Thermoleophilia bacterium]